MSRIKSLLIAIVFGPPLGCLIAAFGMIIGSAIYAGLTMPDFNLDFRFADLNNFSGFFLISAVIAWVVTVIFGLPIALFMQNRNIQKPVFYVIPGIAVTTVIVSVVLIYNQRTLQDAFIVIPSFSLYGASVSYVTAKIFFHLRCK